MTDVMPSGEEEPQELDAPEPQALASELGLELSADEQAEAEAMVARLKSQFGLDEGAQEEPEPEPSEPEAEPEPEPQPEPEPEPVEAESWISIDGRQVPVEEARSMMELRRYLEANPETAQRVRAAIEGQPAPEPQPEPAPEPQPPDFLDIEDPRDAFIWEQFKRQHQQINQLQQTQAQNAAEAARSRAVNDVQEAMNTFRVNHPELTEDDIQIVRNHAVGLDIIDGLSRHRSGSEAVLKALDIAYLDHPEFRAKATGTPSPKEQKAEAAKERKQKLAGIAGSSVSATRQPEPEVKPTSDREARAMAAKWLSEQNIL